MFIPLPLPCGVVSQKAFPLQPHTFLLSKTCFYLFSPLCRYLKWERGGYQDNFVKRDLHNSRFQVKNKNVLCTGHGLITKLLFASHVAGLAGKLCTVTSNRQWHLKTFCKRRIVADLIHTF